MAEDKDDDVLAGEHADEGEGAWLDLSIPQVVHDKLAAWGARVGLTADGYAKLILLHAMHAPLAAEEDVKRFTSPASDPDPGATSREMWAHQLQKYRAAEDLAPAPVATDDSAGWRTYSAKDFDWGEANPPAFAYATVDRTGALTVSDRPPKAEQVSDEKIYERMLANLGGVYSAQLPQPCKVESKGRLYKTADFAWLEGEKRPRKPFLFVRSDGKFFPSNA